MLPLLSVQNLLPLVHVNVRICRWLLSLDPRQRGGDIRVVGPARIHPFIQIHQHCVLRAQLTVKYTLHVAMSACKRRNKTLNTSQNPILKNVLFPLYYQYYLQTTWITFFINIQYSEMRLFFKISFISEFD